MILYGSTMSPFVRKVAAYAAEKGVETRAEADRPTNPTPEFCAASPFRKMPALVDGDYSLADSSAIIHYLEAKYPEPELIPAEPRERGRVIWFDEFADTILFGCGARCSSTRWCAALPWPRGRRGGRRPRGTRRIAADPRLSGDRGARPRRLLVGDKLTLADIAVASPFANFRHLGVGSTGIATRRPRPMSSAILARPSFSRISRAGSGLSWPGRPALKKGAASGDGRGPGSEVRAYLPSGAPWPPWRSPRPSSRPARCWCPSAFRADEAAFRLASFLIARLPSMSVRCWVAVSPCRPSSGWPASDWPVSGSPRRSPTPSFRTAAGWPGPAAAAAIAPC